jgi:hypothetical protein
MLYVCAFYIISVKSPYSDEIAPRAILCITPVANTVPMTTLFHDQILKGPVELPILAPMDMVGILLIPS